MISPTPPKRNSGKRLYALLLLAACLMWISGAEAGAQTASAGENLVLDGIPPLPKEKAALQLPYLNVRAASFADWLPDGSALLMATRFGNIAQLHVVERPMGVRRQVTFYNDPVYRGEFGRKSDPNLILFSMYPDGNERDQIYVHDLRKGRSTMLTDGTSVNRSPAWSNKSSQYAFTTTKRNGADFDVHVARADTPTSPSRPVIALGGSWQPLDWAPDDTKLLVMKYISANESHLYVADLNSTATLRVNGKLQEKVSYDNAIYSRDGEGIFYTSDQGSEFQRLHYFDLRHEVSKPIVDDLNWDISSMTLNEDGRLLAFVTNENGMSKLYMLNTKTLSREPYEIPAGIIGSMGFNPKDDRLAFTLLQPTSPGDIYVYDLAAKKLERWTQSEAGGLPESTFIPMETIAYRTFDKDGEGAQRRIPAYVYKPKTPGPWPVLIEIHGGPESQERPTFDSFRQFVLNEMGIAMITPNVRGSAGYGKSYLLLDNGEKREDSVKDIGALLDWIAMQPEFDESRVAVMGSSYGGYMVLAAMAAYPDRIACGIDGVGISNFVTFLESTSEYRRDLRRAEYGDERIPEMREFLQKISPTTVASQIRSPLFVVQGANDPRVPRTEAEQIVKAVRDNGKDVWYLLAMNEGHGLVRKENRDVYRAAAACFLEQYLLPKARESSDRATDQAKTQ